jgi:hypothetical protein
VIHRASSERNHESRRLQRGSKRSYGECLQAEFDAVGETMRLIDELDGQTRKYRKKLSGSVRVQRVADDL